MNVLIVNTNRHNQPFPVMPLGACMVAGAVAQAGHWVQMLDFMFEADPISALRRKLTGYRFDIVGLSIRNIDNNDMRSPKFFIEGLPDLVHTIRELSEARIVIGVDKGAQALLKIANVKQDSGVVDTNDKDAFIAAAKTRQWAREKFVPTLA